MLLNLLLKRNNTFYFRWQIPADLRSILGKREFLRSLRTDDQVLALHRASEFYILVDQIKLAWVFLKMEKLSEQNFQHVLDDLWRLADSTTVRQPRNIEELKYFRELLDKETNHYKTASMTTTGALSPKSESIYNYLGRHLADHLEDMGVSEYTEALFDRLVREYIHVVIYNCEKSLDSLSVDSYKSKVPNFIQSKSLGHDETETLFSDAWKQYVQEKQDSGKWTVVSDVAERNAEFRDFLEIIGGNKSVSSFSKEQARTTRKALLSFPKNRTKLFADIALPDIPDTADKISESTAKQRLDTIKGFFSYLVQEEVLNTTPFANINISAKKISYATYTESDLHQLFNIRPILCRKDWQYWIPRIGLYSGARQDEIAQLTVSDVRQDVETQIWYFSINDQNGKTVKTAAAIRRVPIHSELMNHGFLGYVDELRKESRADASLWPDLNPKAGKLGQNVSRYWTDLKSKHGVLDNPTDHEGRKKVFHSLRRVFINKLREANVETETLQILVGHEPGLGTTKIYLDEVSKPISDLSDAVSKLAVSGIGWDRVKS